MMYLLNLHKAIDEDMEIIEMANFQTSLINKISLAYPEYIGGRIEVEFPIGINHKHSFTQVILRTDLKGRIRTKQFLIPHTGREGINIAFEEFKEITQQMEQVKDLSRLLKKLI